MLCAGLKSFISFCAVSFVQGEGCSAQCKGCSVKLVSSFGLVMNCFTLSSHYSRVSGMFVTVMVVMRRMVR